MTRAQLKAAAKGQIKGNILTLLVMFVIYMLICSVPLVNFILAPVLTMGLFMTYLKMTNGMAPSIGGLFDGLGIGVKAWVLNFLVGLFTFLWSMLFVIPGIIKGLSYSMSYFILAERPEMSAREALNESKKMMDGHKMDLFVLSLSFIGWILLSVVTMGIALIYVYPYMMLTITNFYQDIKGPEVVGKAI